MAKTKWIIYQQDTTPSRDWRLFCTRETETLLEAIDEVRKAVPQYPILGGEPWDDFCLAGGNVRVSIGEFTTFAKKRLELLAKTQENIASDEPAAPKKKQPQVPFEAHAKPIEGMDYMAAVRASCGDPGKNQGRT